MVENREQNAFWEKHIFEGFTPSSAYSKSFTTEFGREKFQSRLCKHSVSRETPSRETPRIGLKKLELEAHWWRQPSFLAF